MEKRAGYLITIFVIFLIIIISLISLKFTGYLIKEQVKQVQFYFYDDLTNCSLNGYVFSGENLIGKSYDGYFNLTYESYKENFQNNENNSEISIFGKLGNCFNKNSDLYFDKYWESFEIQNYYFSGESIFNFKTQITPHSPSKRELIGFVQPNKVKSELDPINIKRENTLDDLSAINQYLNDKISYEKDWSFEKETNYWQTPKETLELKKGDCEDYSVTLLSLFLAYNNSLNCYNLIFSSHVTTFCYINNYYIYYDQEKTELKKQINKINTEETKSQLEKLKQDYFEHYGINTTNETETKVHYAFNDNQFIEFNSEDDFINWQYNLKNQKSEQNIFQILEQQAIEAEKLYNEIEYKEGELATQKPSATSALALEKPSLKGFFMENSILLISLGVMIIILIIILIKINKK